MMSPERLAEGFPSCPASVGAIRSAVVNFAARGDFSDEKLEAIKTAVSEAATNAIVHGYGGGDGEVTLSAELSGEVLRIAIVDHGHGMLPRRETHGLGLGLPLISTIADHLEIISPTAGGGTEVQMHFNARCSDR